VIYLFNSTLSGEMDDLEAIVGGDPDRHVIGKLDRTLFVINQCDELADPVHAYEEFAQQAERKRAELLQLLAATGAARCSLTPVARNRILTTASSPFGHAVNTRRDADGYRDWDGFREAEHAIAALGNALSVNGLDVTLLHGGCARLAVLRERAADQAERLRLETAQLGLLLQDATDQARAGRLIAADRRASLSRGVADFLDGLLAEALNAEDSHDRRALAGRLKMWSKDPELLQRAAEWQDESVKQIGLWERTTRTLLTRRVGSRPYLAAFPDFEPLSGLGFLRSDLDEEAEEAVNAVYETAKTIASVLMGIDDESVYEWASFLGSWITPDEASDIAAQVVDVGVDLTGGLMLIGPFIDAARLTRRVWRERKFDAERSRLISKLHDDGQRWAGDITDGRDERAGMASEIEARCGELDEIARGLAETRSARQQALAATERRMTIYQRLTDSARTHLGTPGGR
jgi:hypothetical protein